MSHQLQFSFNYFEKQKSIQLIFPFSLSRSSIKREHSKRQKSLIFGNDTIKYCCYCEIPLSFEEATVEHIIPISKGGPDKLENLTIACPSCNNHRDSSYSFEEWRDIVKKKI